MKLASLAYVPPPSFGCASVFHSNLRKFTTRYDLITYSDHPWPDSIRIKNPEGIEKMMKDNVRRDGFNRWAVNNAIFMTGMRIAISEGCTHVIYLESDCRVGCDDWDATVFEEYFQLGRACIGAGTLACYNPCNYSRKAALAWEKLVSNNTARNMPVATYGWKGASDRHPSCVFPNGALSVLDVGWMSGLFNLERTIVCATENTAWDMALGQKVWDMFKEDSFEVMGMLNSVFSSYGDILTTEEERLTWLRDGRYVAVHQVKSQNSI
jgi:hypothetical protein